MRKKLLIITILAGCFLFNLFPQNYSGKGIVREEFIFDHAPFPSCHAATIAETPDGLVAAWFGGTHERHPDVGIWISRKIQNRWTAPVEVANGVINDTLRYPTWNPVLYQVPGLHQDSGLSQDPGLYQAPTLHQGTDLHQGFGLNQGPGVNLLLFYKMGPSPSEWKGMLTLSRDGGISWSSPENLPEDYIGPVKNKPVLLDNGMLICPSSTEDKGWRVHFELTGDFGKTWQMVGPLNDGSIYSAIQPTILKHGNGRLQMLCRSKNGRILESWSSDYGQSWSLLQETELPNNNSGIDAVTLLDGRHLLVYNHVKTPMGASKGYRTPLNVAVSKDGKQWYAALVLEDSEIGQYSYPSVIQSSDSMVHIVYTWRRKKIKYVMIDPSKLKLKKIKDGRWPE
jgi:alpha-L-rhamnosidase